MPEFRIRRPTSITDSLRALLTSSPNLTAADQAAIDNHVATVAQRTALADKARWEVESARTAEAFRNDPENALTMAAVQAGIPLPIARQARDYALGMEGIERPDLTPEQDRAFRAVMTGAMANRLATGKTNADQLTHGVRRTQDSILANRAAEIANAGEQAPLLAAAGLKPREPFANPNAQGLVTNQETGTVTVGNTPLYQAVLGLTGARTGQANAAAGASDARRRLTNREIDVDLPGARASQADAAAEASRAAAGQRKADVEAGGPQARAGAARGRGAASQARAEEGAMQNDLRKQSEVRSRFKKDPEMKGRSVGAWVPGKGYEVKKDGIVIGHYD